jgi:hypothetical protein
MGVKSLNDDALRREGDGGGEGEEEGEGCKLICCIINWRVGKVDQWAYIMFGSPYRFQTNHRRKKSTIPRI